MTDLRKSRCDVLFQGLIASGGAGMTRKQAAVLLGIKPTNYLAGLIDELVFAGFARKETKTLSNGLPYFVYYPTDHALEVSRAN